MLQRGRVQRTTKTALFEALHELDEIKASKSRKDARKAVCLNDAKVVGVGSHGKGRSGRESEHNECEHVCKRVWSINECGDGAMKRDEMVERSRKEQKKQH